MRQAQEKVLRRGKFNALILSILLFVVLDLGVLLLNLYYSARIDQDAATINIAGRQRMLSQKITKSLFQVGHALDSQTSAQNFVTELTSTIELFDTTLQAFNDPAGRLVPGTDGRPVRIQQVDSFEAFETLTRAQGIWEAYRQRLVQFTQSFSQKPESSRQALVQALAQANQDNLPLLKLMNDLTNQLERSANDRVFKLRLIQALAVLVALLNFVFILLHYNKQLRVRDDAIQGYDAELAHISQLPSMKGPDQTLDQAPMAVLLNSKESARRRVSITKALIEELNSKDLVDSLMVWECEFAEREQFSMLEFINRLAARGHWGDLKRKQMHLKLIHALTVDFHHSLV